MSKEEIRKEISMILPKKKVVNSYNFSPNPDIINNAEVRREGYNHALSTIADTLAERSVEVGKVLFIMRKAFKKFKEGKGKFNSYEYTVAQALIDECIILRKEEKE